MGSVRVAGSEKYPGFYEEPASDRRERQAVWRVLKYAATGLSRESGNQGRLLLRTRRNNLHKLLKVVILLY
jgi:hypothetical protein